MNPAIEGISGAGLGLRRPYLKPFTAEPPEEVDFFELAPENWIGVGGAFGKRLGFFTERWPVICHGLSLSIGGPHRLNESLVRDIGAWMDEHGVRLYSEHLSYTSDDGQLYDLLPIPFTGEAVHYVSARIRRVQDILGQRIAIENVSYYASMGAEMDDAEFLTAVLDEADCGLLLDVNNVYVNSINHRFDARAFLDSIPAERVLYIHTAGHYDEAPDLLIDTHGATVKEEVWDLLAYVYARIGPRPTVLERDFNQPPLPELLAEVTRIREVQRTCEPGHLLGNKGAPSGNGGIPPGKQGGPALP